jgi:hypothetical protein
MSKKSSTAALVSKRAWPRRLPCRAPRHPAGTRTENRGLRKEWRLQRFQQAQIVIRPEEAMHSTYSKPVQNIRTIVPVILRITLSLILWTLGASMSLSAGELPAHRNVHIFPADHEKIEALQRWVNAGHDPWCRDAKLVAAASLENILGDSDSLEPASLTLEIERAGKASSVFAFHSLDGRVTYRVTLRRYDWLRPVAGSREKTIWVPESVEIVTQRAADDRNDQAQDQQVLAADASSQGTNPLF